MDIAASIDWNRIESILMNHCQVGGSIKGAEAYPPILLFKSLLIQKWFHIESDPELESQINDRISFKKFLGYVDKLSIGNIHAPLNRRGLFESIISKRKLDKNKFPTPRYMVNLAYGAKFEPWIVSVQPLDVNPDNLTII